MMIYEHVCNLGIYVSLFFFYCFTSTVSAVSIVSWFSGIDHLTFLGEIMGLECCTPSSKGFSHCFPHGFPWFFPWKLPWKIGKPKPAPYFRHRNDNALWPSGRNRCCLTFWVKPLMQMYKTKSIGGDNYLKILLCWGDMSMRQKLEIIWECPTLPKDYLPEFAMETWKAPILRCNNWTKNSGFRWCYLIFP